VMALGIEAGGEQRGGQKERKNSPKGMHGGSLAVALQSMATGWCCRNGVVRGWGRRGSKSEGSDGLR
jgi:hypothetical protein